MSMAKVAGVGRVGQKVLSRASGNRIFCLLLPIKCGSARRASRHPAFIVLFLIKGMRREGQFKIFFCYRMGLRAYPHTYCEQDGVI